MSDIFKNLRGTTRDVFKIGKNGSNIFVRDTEPSTLEGFNGDWCLLNSTVPTLLKKMNDTWVDVNALYLFDVTGTSFTYVPTTSDDVIVCDHTSALTITIDTLPEKGHTFVIKDASGNASTNNITLDCINGITIDGSAQQVINSDYSSVTLLSTGSELYIL